MVGEVALSDDPPTRSENEGEGLPSYLPNEGACKGLLYYYGM